MNSWKAILAMLVIFSAGAFAGAILAVKVWPADLTDSIRAGEDTPFYPREVREDYIRWLAKELHLTSQQTEKITQDIGESQQRIRILFEFIGPEMREEMKEVRQSIKAVLTPEQQSKFEEFRKRRSRRSPDAASAEPHSKQPAPETETKPAAP